MALGTLTNIAQNILPGGPTFVDRVTLVGDASYVNGTGTTGLQAALQALRKDKRAIISVKQYKVTGTSSFNHSVRYDPATDVLTGVVDAGTPTEESTGSLAAFTYYLEILSQ